MASMPNVSRRRLTMPNAFFALPLADKQPLSISCHRTIEVTSAWPTKNSNPASGADMKEAFQYRTDLFRARPSGSRSLANRSGASNFWPMCPRWPVRICSATLTPAWTWPAGFTAVSALTWAGRRLLRPASDSAIANAAHCFAFRPAPANQNARMAAAGATPITHVTLLATDKVAGLASLPTPDNGSESPHVPAHLSWQYRLIA